MIFWANIFFFLIAIKPIRRHYVISGPLFIHTHLDMSSKLIKILNGWANIGLGFSHCPVILWTQYSPTQLSFTLFFPFYFCEISLPNRQVFRPSGLSLNPLSLPRPSEKWTTALIPQPILICPQTLSGPLPFPIFDCVLNYCFRKKKRRRKYSYWEIFVFPLGKTKIKTDGWWPARKVFCLLKCV